MGVAALPNASFAPKKNHWAGGGAPGPLHVHLGAEGQLQPPVRPRLQLTAATSRPDLHNTTLKNIAIVNTTTQCAPGVHLNVYLDKLPSIGVPALNIFARHPCQNYGALARREEVLSKVL